MSISISLSSLLPIFFIAQKFIKKPRILVKSSLLKFRNCLHSILEVDSSQSANLCKLHWNFLLVAYFSENMDFKTFFKDLKMFLFMTSGRSESGLRSLFEVLLIPSLSKDPNLEVSLTILSRSYFPGELDLERPSISRYSKISSCWDFAFR